VATVGDSRPKQVRLLSDFHPAVYKLIKFLSMTKKLINSPLWNDWNAMYEYTGCRPIDKVHRVQLVINGKIRAV
jgi:hypothetical protein